MSKIDTAINKLFENDREPSEVSLSDYKRLVKLLQTSNMAYKFKSLISLEKFTTWGIHFINLNTVNQEIFWEILMVSKSIKPFIFFLIEKSPY